MKKLLFPVVAVTLIGLGAFLNSDKISQSLYLIQDSLTSDVKEEPFNYKTTNKDESDYLVYFYDMKQCDKCGDYVNELKKYEGLDGSFPVYKVNLEKLEPEVLSEKLFIDPTQPYVFHVKGGDDFYSYIGGFTADKLPTETNQANPL